MANHSNKLIETKDLVFLWKIVTKNIAILIVVPVIAYAIGFIYTYRLAETYASRTELLLKSNETYDYQDPIYKGLGAYGAYTDALNQIKILTSRDLIEEVIEKVDIGTSYYVIGRLKRQEVYKTLPFTSEINVLNNALYEIPVSVKVLNPKEYELSYDIDDKQKKYKYYFDQELITDDFSLLLQKSYDFNEENINVIKESQYELVFHSKNYLINKYQQNLKVENVEYTSVLAVEVTDELEYRAKTFLDTLNSVYVDFSLRTQLEVNENTLRNIEKQIDTISVFIKNKEEELLMYSDENAILNISKEEDDYFVKYLEYQNVKRLLEYDKVSIIGLEEYLKNSSDEHILPPNSTLKESDSYIRTSIEKIYSLQLEVVSKSYSQSESNLNMIQQKQKIAELKKDLLIYLKNLKETYNSRISDIDSKIAISRSNIKRLPRSAQGIENIKRELEVNTKMYLFLLEKKTNTLITRAGIIPQVRVIESPRTLGVVAPDRTKIVRLYVLFGFILSLIIAVIRKIFFERIENIQELDAVNSLTIAGGIPFVKIEMQNQLIVESQPKSQVTESFRTVRTNLMYLGSPTKRAKKLLISSYYPGEGKTFCSTNLASLISKGDKKVLVLDFDLHKPKVHKTFGLDNQVGISTFLVGKNKIDEILRKEVHKNLDIITAGTVPPNPSELILKQQVNDLFEWAENEYDLIIVDTPPFGLLNDAFELLPKMDVFLVVINTRFARRRGVLLIEEMLAKQSKVSKGMILNGIRQTKFQYYYAKYTYKYSYGYSKYGYGYGNYGESYTNSED
jgi:capsular exopolysaccharide synthesis family protein